MILRFEIKSTIIKNEEYVSRLKDINFLYQEVCERNMYLEKVSKNSKNQENDDFTSQK